MHYIEVAKRISGVGLVLALLLTLVIGTLSLPVQASPETDAWNKYPIPQEGEAGGWVLTGGGTGVTAISVAFDGTIYAATEEIAGSPLGGYNLFKSTDDGYTWTPLWQIPSGDGGSKIIALTLPQQDDSRTLYLATEYNVYKSTDSGRHFTSLVHAPTTSGTTPTHSSLITSFDVTDHHGTNLVAVGTRDADSSDYGGAYLYNESQPFTPLTDLRVGGAAAGTKYDVLAVAFSPNFTEDEQMVAVVTDEANTIVTTKLGSGDWGAEVGDAVLSGIAASGGCLAFPADYDSDVLEDKYVQYVGLNVSGVTGGVYMVLGDKTPNYSMAVPASVPAPVHSLAAAGDAFDPVILISEGYDPTIIGPIVVAGLTNGSVINTTTGVAYTPPSAPPATNTCVALGTFHGSGYYVYAGTSGINGGFARSVDSGATFARTALICDALTTIADLAASPIYDKDGTIYMITQGLSGNKILWRTTNRGKTWDAVLTEGQQIAKTIGLTETVGDFDKVALSPRFKTDTTAFIGESGNEPNMWRSTDNGSRFRPLPQKATTAAIDSLAVAGIKKVLVGDSLGNFYKTTNGGSTWSEAVATGLSDFSSMVISPDYDTDHTILAGDNSGNVYRSTDDGETWRQPGDSAVGTGATYVTFDPDYASNRTFYAASVSAGNLAVQRYQEDDEWRSIVTSGISSVTTSGATGLACSPDGTLYVSDSTAAGVFRCLNPMESPTTVVEWENATEDIGTANLDTLFLTGGSNVLLGYNGATVWTYEDTLTEAVDLSSPGDGANTERVDSATLAWDAMDSAKQYNIKVNTDRSFEGVDYSRPADTRMTSVRVTGLEDGQTYYWKVRVNSPALSRWSQVRSFNTALGAPQWNPFVGGVPEAPYNGATNVPLTPSFAWNPADWATGYEFVLSRDAAFSDVVVTKTGANTLTTTVYLSEQKLDYSTTYYWKVRATSKTTDSEWASAVFTTEGTAPAPPAPPPAPPAPPPAPKTPISIWVIIGIMGALVITLLVLIVNTRRP